MADLSAIDGIKGDKHSTGGVGDKTTLVVAPVVASCGVKMAKMSGRGLGHTGGTVDKLESIPGFRTSLSTDEFTDIVNTSGLCVAGQSGRLCPADKKLYGLRDVTATVDNMPLIASSIMSKKLAGGADCIVLDVKCGSGAFMKDKTSAQALAAKMVEIGRGAGRKIAALITDMDIPLGYAIGNSVEVKEAIATLKGEGPRDFTEVCVALASNMLRLAGHGNEEECKQKVLGAIENGSALDTFIKMVKAQGGNEEWIKTPELFPSAKFSRKVKANKSGYIERVDTEGYGISALILGAGRNTKEDEIDYSAGIILSKKTGDYVKEGDTIATLYTSYAQKLDASERKFIESTFITDKKPILRPLVLDKIE
jgi:pyrimidine-nucleoside phosphorylase